VAHMRHFAGLAVITWPLSTTFLLPPLALGAGDSVLLNAAFRGCAEFHGILMAGISKTEESRIIRGFSTAGWDNDRSDDVGRYTRDTSFKAPRLDKKSTSSSI
jgi:hypothetical protein